jgi:hypothetical protein
LFSIFIFGEAERVRITERCFANVAFFFPLSNKVNYCTVCALIAGADAARSWTTGKFVRDEIRSDTSHCCFLSFCFFFIFFHVAMTDGERVPTVVRQCTSSSYISIHNLLVIFFFNFWQNDGHSKLEQYATCTPAVNHHYTTSKSETGEFSPLNHKGTVPGISMILLNTT